MKKALNLFGIAFLLVFLASCPQPASNSGSPTIDTDVPQDEITKLILTAAADMFVPDTQLLNVELRTTSGEELDYTEKVEWILSDADKDHLSIDKGLATANSVATVTVEAKYEGVFSNSVEIKISEEGEIKSLTIDSPDDMFVGEVQQLGVTLHTTSGEDLDYTGRVEVKWRLFPGDEKNLSIDNKGVATAKSPATVTVTAVYNDDIESDPVEIKIAALEEIESLMLATPNDMPVYATQQLKVTLHTTNEELDYADKVEWILSDADKVHLSIDNNGVATAKSVATVTVSAKYNDIVSNEVEIKITQPKVETPVISRSELDFLKEQTVKLESGTKLARIYYTTNGDVPTTASVLYSTPFLITQTTTIKAIAVKAGYIDSTVAEATFERTVWDIGDKGPGGGLVFFHKGPEDNDKLERYEVSGVLGTVNWGYAQELANGYKGGGFNWTMPVPDELKSVYRDLSKNNPHIATGETLWTKHSYFEGKAWVIYFDTDNYKALLRPISNTYNVRAVRKF